jgi:hypothetical protein
MKPSGRTTSGVSAHDSATDSSSTSTSHAPAEHSVPALQAASTTAAAPAGTIMTAQKHMPGPDSMPASEPHCPCIATAASLGCS